MLPGYFLLAFADLIHLSSFQIYFPHVDNIYSHRSTQKYKKKPFISHYWDCRLKGRPAGTAKSDDPSKKKRKRVARERDLCDVKIKITEYLPGATRDEIQNHLSQQPRREAIGLDQLVATVESSPAVCWDTGPAGYGQITRRFYTLQRVNGTGPSGKEEGGGSHKHAIEDSDKIKKNSVERWMAKISKEPPKRKAPVALVCTIQCFSSLFAQSWSCMFWRIWLVSFFLLYHIRRPLSRGRQWSRLCSSSTSREQRHWGCG